ncbi:MAG: DUF4011 domain-containing protein [Clostridia bacterium]|nr:DUF4011 domain-containing protein [Clostridia bacterium]
MAQKKKINQLETITIEGELLNSVSYATYYCRLPLFTAFRIFNNGETAVQNLTISISGSTDLILPTEIIVDEIPAESSVTVSADNLLNPKYLTDIDEPLNCTVTVKLNCGKVSVSSLSADVCALPIDCWSGLSGNVEMLSAFVRPKMADCQKILSEAANQLKNWGYYSEWSGYSGNDKNAVRNAVAAIFTAIRRLNIERDEPLDITQNVTTGDITKIISSGFATPLQMAIFAASCFEAAKLNPVIILGKNKIGVGVWLYESCFTVTTQDDISVIEKYVTEGVNNLSVIDVDDIFAHKNASFTTCESHFLNAVKRDEFEICVDVKRCRIGGIFPLPLKIKAGKGYELLKSDQFSYDEKPKDLIDAEKFALEKGASKDKTWQRKLLDLSMKNNLLNFRYRRDAIHVLSSDVTEFCKRLEEVNKFSVLPQATKQSDAVYFGATDNKNNLGELISIELSSGNMRTYCSLETLTEYANSLIRKARISEEEVGAKTLFLAVGFLKWRQKDEKEYKYAPLSLLPVTLKRTKTSGVTIETGDEFQANTTLLEFLKQEFGIDIRGLDGKGLSPQEIMAVFRNKTANAKGWEVYGDVYISQFTFARYAMWADVKNNISTYKKNALISSLLTNTNKISGNFLTAEKEDDSNLVEVLTPLPCDSSQYEAVAESAKGTTFVLHGPPGTGKSQTITNIIANAVHKGKRVLFVAEKQAALQVVKKRLNEIGIGEFCLELHSGKSADKTEIVRSIENTLSLNAEIDNEKFNSAASNLINIRSSLKKPLKALHKKRRLGCSVYEGILYYLQNKNAPELVNIESTFYDSLTKKKLEDCENMLLTAQAAAKGCGGVHRSPFDNVALSECDDKIKNSVLVSAEVVIAELKHLKNYLGLFLETFNQKISVFTAQKLNNLIQIVTVLKDDVLSRFFTCNEEEFYKFYNANLRYDSEVKHWLANFKCLPDIAKLAPQIESELDNWGENYRSSKVLSAVIKRINRCAKQDVAQKDEIEWIKRAYEIELAKDKILRCTNLSANFLAFGGVINDKKREEFLRPLYALHKLCAQTFMDYNADAFNSVCVSSISGFLKPLLSGLISAANAFIRSADSFIKTVKGNKDLILDEDVFDYYSAKCGALIDNIDMLPAWAMYKATAKKLNESGLTFITDAMESGKISGEQILSSFRKNVYRNFIQTNIPADDTLASFSAAVLDENAANFSVALEEFAHLTREKIRADLISRLPAKETEGPLALELMSFQRSVKGNLRGFSLRQMFLEIPELLKVVAPCLLMSPYTVSQYLPSNAELFDIVIFDEASQMPTCEAVPSLARAKSAIIVGDPKQMPPTSFFSGSGFDEENLETEDLESVLEDCLALGIPEKHLNWHYRSKHESLIAFSNVTYYSSNLCTFPSPDAMDSKVSLQYIENGIYDRGASKCNKEEANALVSEVIKRLKDDKLKNSSIGIVTFSTPQQVYIERLINRAIAENGLEDVAFEREEPLFIKNLENVQGDERDVILFSVCYGPDKYGKISLNFGPLNQFGGWRRLNVAVSRAREEMMVFSSMRYSMIDLSRTTSRGVAGLKAFLEFAEKGRTSISVKSDEIILNKNGIGKYIAEELSNYGYECRCDVGVSSFKIDVAVVDPKNKHNFILAVLCDGTQAFSIKDRSVMQVQTLKRNNWNVLRLYSINFFNNPKREIKKIKEYLDKLTSNGKPTSINFKKPYRTAKVEEKQTDASYILSGENDLEIIKVIKAVVAAEEPISLQFLIKRTLSAFGIYKFGIKLETKMRSLINQCEFYKEELLGYKYFFKNEKRAVYDRYRVEEKTQLRVSDTDFTPYDIISLIKGILLNKVSLYCDELILSVVREFNLIRPSDKLTKFVNSCIDLGVYEGFFIRSISDRISLA